MAQTTPEFIELPSGESWQDSTRGGGWARLSGRRSKELKELDGALNGYAKSRAVAARAFADLVHCQGEVFAGRMPRGAVSSAEIAFVRAFLRADSSLDEVNRTFAQHRHRHSGRDQQQPMSALGARLESASRGSYAGWEFVAGLRRALETVTDRDYPEQLERESRKPGMLNRMVARLRTVIERRTSEMRREHEARHSTVTRGGCWSSPGGGRAGTVRPCGRHRRSVSAGMSRQVQRRYSGRETAGTALPNAARRRTVQTTPRATVVPSRDLGCVRVSIRGVASARRRWKMTTRAR